jgi:nucleoid-associated protein YgaU
MYSDPALWRAIALANRLDDPRQLQIGQRLQIPKIT